MLYCLGIALLLNVNINHPHLIEKSPIKPRPTCCVEISNVFHCHTHQTMTTSQQYSVTEPLTIVKLLFNGLSVAFFRSSEPRFMALVILYLVTFSRKTSILDHVLASPCTRHLRRKHVNYLFGPLAKPRSNAGPAKIQ